MSEEQTVNPTGGATAIASFVLGIIGVLLGLIPGIGILFGFIFWVLATIFGYIGRRSARKGLATAGLVMGVGMVVYQLLFLLLFGYFTVTPGNLG
ncbi:hypothetical protein N781_01645 [Pontibacillus halophilus JSM 076056 = DSM 19796]|uniref:DUF4190 domain-containing protein n=1 Tax=Pontibacillus halophilus JSM 076056 = DSM 19796 TaxID=1385510 RepID=A0A0A5GRP3_9BACI|nr:hypothetical protein [Pontibacillus halophilus]KGX93913.1 hypothetical protein N781_01645 [Pontibacillus halophilus JSM 076056 = DSM 19796]